MVGLITPAELLSVLGGQMGDMPSGPEACRLPGRAVGSCRAGLSVDAVTAWLGISLPPRSASATLAGIILERLGHIPVQGERLHLQGWELEITRMEGRRIDEVRAIRLPKAGKNKRAAL